MRRVVVFVLTVSLTAGCFRWQPLALSEAASARLGRVAVRRGSERDELILHRVDASGVEGWSLRAGQEQRWQLGAGERLEVRRLDPFVTGMLVGGLYATVLALSWFAVVRDLPGISGR